MVTLFDVLGDKELMKKIKKLEKAVEEYVDALKTQISNLEKAEKIFKKG